MGPALNRRAAALLCIAAALLGAAVACDRPIDALQSSTPGSAAPPLGEVRSLDVFVAGDRVHRLVGTAVPEPEHERSRHLRLWHRLDEGAQGAHPTGKM